MARFSTDGIAAFSTDIEKLGEDMDIVLDEMLNAEADVIIPSQQKTAMEMGVYRTGATAASISRGKPKQTKSGKAIYVYPRGSVKRGKTQIRTAEIAFLNEFGTKTQPARPFIRRANEKSAEAAVEAAEKVYDEHLKKKGF